MNLTVKMGRILSFEPQFEGNFFLCTLLSTLRHFMENENNSYQAGICNIGNQEVKVRKKFIRFFIPVTIFFTFSCIWWCHSLLLWIFLVLSTFSLIVLYFEVKYRFCILFGFFSLYNFDRLGELHEVKNAEQANKDRKRVYEIAIVSMLLALSFSTAVHLLATCIIFP
ncbi:MAG: hypothetical protein DWQ44_02460 [Bacteroidetes bacterium]|nr:MAG: hypothetical protein DWQ33_06190 [Bacteroidota bacterium]REK04834.1 MAG: hypothetical protein DWQ39_06355 [Bacteroidota bacterium]REK36306.1 MAG: hypothetical protein DWQ44_02460 [Bacteroidota bacterium]REK51028.1 MAG: hypothetical protein DWQ48_02760 [Bacteroidota bacterium]